jgi:hypothetical protein
VDEEPEEAALAEDAQAAVEERADNGTFLLCVYNAKETAPEEAAPIEEARLRIRSQDCALTGSVLQYAAGTMRGDHDVVLAAVAKNGCALNDADETLRGHRDVVISAAANSGLRLQEVHEAKRADRKVVLAAVAAFNHMATGSCRPNIGTGYGNCAFPSFHAGLADLCTSC